MIPLPPQKMSTLGNLVPHSLDNLKRVKPTRKLSIPRLTRKTHVLLESPLLPSLSSPQNFGYPCLLTPIKPERCGFQLVLHEKTLTWRPNEESPSLIQNGRF